MNRKWKSLIVALALSSLPVAPHTLLAQQPAPDNTKVNKRDRQAGEQTADQQKNDKADLETTRQIRKAITADESLSTYAHNIKIITVNGKVTLKGPVRSEDEKGKIEKIASDAAGAGNVVDQIAIQGAGDSTTHTKPHHKPAKVNP